MGADTDLTLPNFHLMVIAFSSHAEALEVSQQVMTHFLSPSLISAL